MTEPELQLIMSAFENHREDVRQDLTEMKAYMKCEIGNTTALVRDHQRRFEAFDTITKVATRIVSWGGVLIAALWAVFTYKWGK